MIICQDAPSIRQVSRSDRTPIAHRFIGGFKDDHMVTVPEGRQPAFRPDSGERPSGTGIYCIPVFPPINRWAIGDLSLPGRKNLPLKAPCPSQEGNWSPLATRNLKNLPLKGIDPQGLRQQYWLTPALHIFRPSGAKNLIPVLFSLHYWVQPPERVVGR